MCVRVCFSFGVFGSFPNSPSQLPLFRAARGQAPASIARCYPVGSRPTRGRDARVRGVRWPRLVSLGEPLGNWELELGDWRLGEGKGGEGKGERVCGCVVLGVVGNC